MITVKTSRPLPSGLERRRYEVTLTDNLGNTHTQVVGMYNHSPDNDGAEVEADVLESKRHAEINTFKSAIEAGDNPFLGDILWNTRDALLKSILDMALAGKPTDAIVYNGLPFLDLVTDGELMALYGQTQVWVDELRAKAAGLLSAKVVFDSYQEVL